MAESINPQAEPEQQAEPLPTAPGGVIPTLADLTYIEKSVEPPA